MNNNIVVEIRAEHYDAQKNFISLSPWKRAHSFVDGFIKVLATAMSGVARNILDITNTSRATAVSTYTFNCQAAAAGTSVGIVVGTGETAVAMADYKLEAQVTVNVAHAIMVQSIEAPDAETNRVVLSRQIQNNTGATLNITEVGLYCQAGVGAYQFCIDRTLYNLSIVSTGIVIITYRITITL